MVGEKYAMLTIVEDLGYYLKEGTVKKRRYVKCKCDCGSERIFRLDCVKNGNTKSCGCLQFKPRGVTHNLTGTPLYRVWASMKQRCSNEKDTVYKWYGERGIKVCTEWNESFEKFNEWALDNGYEQGLTIDRIDVNKDYEPDNCRWITQQEQLLNTRRSVLIEYKGKTMTLKEWADCLGIKYMTLYSRIRTWGWDIERAFSEPVK